MAIEKAIMLQFRGAYVDLDKTKLLPGQIAIVTSGDPNTTSGKAFYVCFAGGEVRRYMDEDELRDSAGITSEQIDAAVARYLEKNPAIAGATAEQVAQINRNTTNIDKKLDKPTTGTKGQVLTVLSVGEDGVPVVGPADPITDITAADVRQIVNEKFNRIAIYADEYVGEDGTLNMADIPIVSNCIVKFANDTYTVNGTKISGIENVMFDMRGAVVTCNDYFLEIVDCYNVAIIGGVYDKAQDLVIKVQNTPYFMIDFAIIKNVGGADVTDATAIKLFGNCDHFCINRCVIDGVTSGVAYSDGYIHAYGILVNRLSSTNAYTKNGVIKQCTITNIAGIDSAERKADGDGIFVQNPPYLNDNGDVEWRKDIHITIDHCVITNCKKRGIKSASTGVYVRNCNISGSFYYAGIDAQYGHMCIENTIVINTSDYTQSVTSAIVANEGGLEVRNCVIKAPYGSNSYHPGIRFGKRLDGSVVPDTEPWENIYIDNCYFDQVSRAVYGHVSDTTAPVPIRGLHITNCRIGVFNQIYAVVISDTQFSAIETFVMTDWRFDYGVTRSALRGYIAEFRYPVSINLNPTITYDLHSRYWLSEPRSGCVGLPSSPHGCIEYVGDMTGGIGGIYYKKYTAHGSVIVGSKNPANVTSTLGSLLLWGSKVGDEYINRSNGSKWICTKAGTVTEDEDGTTSGTIGTWTQITTQTLLNDEILGGAS